MLYVNRRLRIQKDQIVHVTRSLQGKGQILVKENQEVTPDEVLGGFVMSAGFRAVDLSEELSVSPKEALKYLTKPLGQAIFKGELLAYKKGGLVSGKKIVTAPTDGILAAYDDKTGVLKLEFIKQKTELPSAVFGVVEKVDNLRGEVTLRTQATIIYGLLGSGKSRDGLLEFIDGRAGLTDKRSILKDYSERVLMTGGLVYSGALMQAVSLGVRGIITGGINASDFKSVYGGRLVKHGLGTDIGLSLLVTEGFGAIPIGEDIYEICLPHKGHFAILDGNSQRLILPSIQVDSMERVRKTKLPPGEKFLNSEPEAIELKKGFAVRLISAPYLGEQGVVSEIDRTPSQLPSGITTYMVTVQTKTRKLRVPYTNVEVMG